MQLGEQPLGTVAILFLLSLQHPARLCSPSLSLKGSCAGEKLAHIPSEEGLLLESKCCGISQVIWFEFDLQVGSIKSSYQREFATAEAWIDWNDARSPLCFLDVIRSSRLFKSIHLLQGEQRHRKYSPCSQMFLRSSSVQHPSRFLFKLSAGGVDCHSSEIRYTWRTNPVKARSCFSTASVYFLLSRHLYFS